jgi:hypothetical protein
VRPVNNPTSAQTYRTEGETRMVRVHEGRSRHVKPVGKREPRRALQRSTKSARPSRSVGHDGQPGRGEVRRVRSAWGVCGMAVAFGTAALLRLVPWATFGFAEWATTVQLFGTVVTFGGLFYTHLFDDDHADSMPALEAMSRLVVPNVVPLKDYAARR